MKEKVNKTVRLSYGTVFAVFTVIVGALFIWQILDIYFLGSKEVEAGLRKFIFDRQTVQQHFNIIAPAFWIWIGMTVCGFILWEVFPVAKKRIAYSDPRYKLYRLKKRIPASVKEDLQQSFNYVEKQSRIINILWLCCAAVGLAAAIYAIVYLSNPAYFPKKNITGEMLEMVKHIMPCVAAVFAVCAGVAIYEGISSKRQIEHAKKLTAGVKGQVVVKEQNAILKILHHKYFLLGLRIAVGITALSLIIAGCVNENVLEILKKAINICTECIGLG